MSSTTYGRQAASRSSCWRPASLRRSSGWIFPQPTRSSRLPISCRRSRSARPIDQNRTRARPTYDESARSAPARRRTSAPATSAQSPRHRAARTSRLRRRSVVGRRRAAVQRHRRHSHRPSSRPDDIAHSPSQTLAEIIAQVPGVQLQSLFGGVNGAKTRSTCAASALSPPPTRCSCSTAAGSTTSTWPQVDLSTIPLDSIERIEIIRGNSGAVLYGDNAVGGVINIVTKTGVGGPPVSIRAEAGVRLVQPAHGLGLDRDQFRAVVDVVLRQRHQVRRLPRQQRARPAQRRRQPQLHHARPQGLPDGDRRRPEARLPRRPARRSLDRRQRARHQPQGHQHAVRLRQPAGRQRHCGLHQDPAEWRRPDRRRRRTAQRNTQSGFFGTTPIHQLRFDL